ncbi:hypothetical protein SteCoe_24037 [Stentor coeruleus]|uniref:Uncharacterized protein n=1 Tax=Stentor coeruleus TaxID=5963 RepID=A0A1R2BIK8_9CILI|nr:hypothetical protein SteCoe_24037 [Stentor coeruleus]
MIGGNVHFFDRSPAPHLTKPTNVEYRNYSPLKNSAEHLRQIDTGFSYRFLQLDGMPIARTDKRFPMDEKSPMRQRRQLIRESALKMMQVHRGNRSTLS